MLGYIHLKFLAIVLFAGAYSTLKGAIIMNRKLLKRYMIAILFVLIGGIIIKTDLHAAVKKIHISKKNIYTYTNMMQKIKLTNTKSKVKWVSTNKKIATIVDKSGQNGNKVTIKTGNKVGKCKIRATIGNKNYYCNVTVKPDKKISRATLVSVKKTSKLLRVKVKINNRSKKNFEYGSEFILQKFSDGSWVDMKMYIKNYAIPAYLSIAGPNSSNIEVFNLSAFYRIKNFNKGLYRLILNVDYKKSAYENVIFSIK
jgi:hypothetical protein